MSHETSPSTHQPYGLARVTRVWQVPRSTVYAQRNRPTPVAKRGPKPPQSDAALTAAIQAVIAVSPFHGEGHRKIWARLRAQGLRTFKETYNQQWLIERLGFRAPAVIRREFALTPAA